ncbi:MAG: glycine cleavage system protein GcvH [Alphaproteobacteria bacterium]|nr:glycine cleavage system protein GcvH [Alphaproteobacteria bacterium]MCZ6765061.1 glycine cleavage system protein GcvH [Alphaproteobacteria bacterium]
MSARFTENDEWITVDGDTGTVGITNYAQDQLGDIVYVELPEVGKSYKQGEEIGVVESVKAAAEIYAPADGEVIEVNAALTDTPDTINSDPNGGGWIYKLKIGNQTQVDGLMDDAGYKAFRPEA